MSRPPTATVLAAAEGTGAEIAWVVVYVLCWFFVVFPFVLWYAGVRRPRDERRASRHPSEGVGAEPDPSATGASRVAPREDQAAVG